MQIRVHPRRIWIPSDFKMQFLLLLQHNTESVTFTQI